MRQHHVGPVALVALAAIAATAAGCARQAEELLEPQVSLSVEGEPRLVTGSGHIDAGDGVRNFTFHAVLRPDGSVSGSYQILRTDLGTEFSVDVTCLSIVGNQAWIGGIIASTNDPVVRVGTVSYFYAIDNGEGSDVPADIVSLARINDLAGRDVEFCTTRPTLLPPRTVQMGNVQIL
jgi:hypothetical protein